MMLPCYFPVEHTDRTGPELHPMPADIQAIAQQHETGGPEDSARGIVGQEAAMPLYPPGPLAPNRGTSLMIVNIVAQRQNNPDLPRSETPMSTPPSRTPELCSGPRHFQRRICPAAVGPEGMGL